MPLWHTSFIGYRFPQAPSMRSIADALFARTASHLLAEIKEQMQHVMGEVPMAPAWADDLCWPMAEASATCLLRKLTTLVECVHRACLRRAMVPNYKANLRCWSDCRAKAVWRPSGPSLEWDMASSASKARTELYALAAYRNTGISVLCFLLR